MQALVYSDWEKLELTSVSMPEPGPGEVLVRVQAASICGSELEAVRKRSPRRKPPLILGHEFTGVIESLGQGVAGWSKGEEIVSNSVISDGTCPSCKRGLPHLCAHRQLFGMHRPGAFAEFVTVPVSTLIKRPQGVLPALASLTEPLANGVHVSGLLKEATPKTVLLFGAGPIGLLVLQALKLTFDCKVAVVDLSETRLALALRLGADQVFRPEEHGSHRHGVETLGQSEIGNSDSSDQSKIQNAQSTIEDWAGENGIDASVDAVGAEETKAASITALRPGGTAVWIGLHENTSPLNAYDLILPEKRLLGSYACTQEELAKALEWIAKGMVDVSWTSDYPLSEADVAFQSMLHPGPGDVKGVIVMP